MLYIVGKYFMTNQRIRRVDLADIFALHEKEPNSYQVPNENSVKKVCVGDHVKVGILNKELTQIVEHFWVRVIEIAEDGVYTGYLDNTPEILTDLKKKDKIVFTRKNIMATMIYPKQNTKAK